MARASQNARIKIARHKDGKARKIAIHKGSCTTIRTLSRDGYVIITKIDYRGRKTVTRVPQKGGDENQGNRKKSQSN